MTLPDNCLPCMNFSVGDQFFTPKASKRARALFAQGLYAPGKATGDSPGDKFNLNIGSETFEKYYPQIDLNQGTILFWFTPEWNGNDGKDHEFYCDDRVQITKANDNFLKVNLINNSWVGISQVIVDVSSWVRGQTYLVVARWNTLDKLDGTNYCCISVNDVHTFGGGMTGVIGYSMGTQFIGNYSGLQYANGIIEGFTIYRRVLYDGTYGENIGHGDELEQIYNAGSGQDSCEITGSWDVCLAIPTNCTGVEVPATDALQAWSHPHTSNNIGEYLLSDKYYGDSGHFAVYFSGNSYIEVADTLPLRTLPTSAAGFQVEAWVKLSNYYPVIIMAKGNYDGGSGWLFYLTSLGKVGMFVNLANSSMFAESAVSIRDDRWHHVVGSYNDATKKGRVAVDGVWAAESAAGVGVYGGDTGTVLRIGRSSAGGSYYLRGSVGWTRLHTHLHYTPGTDFLPVRDYPGNDANTIEAWLLRTGSGNTAVANVTAPGNNGTITNGAWLQQWFPTTPLPWILNSVIGGTNYVTSVGKAAVINNLAGGAFTVDGWIRFASSSYTTICVKGDLNHAGWLFWMNDVGRLDAYVFSAASTGRSISTEKVNDGYWHYVKMTYNNAGDRKIRLYIDNVETSYITQQAAVDPIGDDSAFDGAISEPTYYMDANCAHGWIRWSNSIRGAGMISRCKPPSVDGNTKAQWNAYQGCGNSLVDSVGGTSTGTMYNTFSWNNSPAMEFDSPNARVFKWGYVFGEATGLGGNIAGIRERKTGLAAGGNYVIRALAYSEDGIGKPYLLVYDNTNSAVIASCKGTVTSREGSADELIATFKLPTVAQFGVGADCTSIDIMMLTENPGGVVGFHSIEMYPNMVDNPSFQIGAGNPWVPTNWGSGGGLAAGESWQEVVEYHSWQYGVGMQITAVDGYLATQLTAVVGVFYGVGAYLRAALNANAQYGEASGGRLYYQSQLINFGNRLPSLPVDTYFHNSAVVRALTTNPVLYLRSYTHTTYFDDIYCIALNAITLYATAATKVGSAESGGLRIDGYDFCYQNTPDDILNSDQGTIRFRIFPRHNIATDDFGYAYTYVLMAYYDANNYMLVQFNAGNVDFHFYYNGNIQWGSWSPGPTGLDPSRSYVFEIIWTPTQARLDIDSSTKILLNGSFKFISTTMHWGCQPFSFDRQVDAVISAP